LPIQEFAVPTEFIIVRHGEPAEAGVEDPPLSERGLRQAEATAAALPTALDGPPAALYVSPLLRARQSAEPLGRALGLEPMVDESIAEFNYGQPYYSEQHTATMGSEVIAQMMASLKDPAFLDRVRTGFDTIGEAHPDATVVAVCHGGVVSAMVTAAVYNDEPIFLPDYGSVTRVTSHGGGLRSLNSYNEASWLTDLRAD
jgi:probable phosphoglycerate mutase